MKHIRTYRGRLEVGRVWIAYRGWKRPTAYRIGSTRVITVGPFAVFIHRRGDLNGARR